MPLKPDTQDLLTALLKAYAERSRQGWSQTQELQMLRLLLQEADADPAADGSG